ncbi:hypothetical protein L596_028060 [Steinernema carpocapsae]|uniref:C2H2-type domain-containing protein n=1 Tax=Steinernema carpocapsae TaxID=34508 RepID=A0A4U5LXB5_STECR|nr:hypothetical protein L596_028060 [Steinernema carpocapsae]
MRSGSGLFWKLAKNLNDKRDSLEDEDVAPPPAKKSKKMSTVHFADETEGDRAGDKERRESLDDDDRLIINEDDSNEDMQASPPYIVPERKESIELNTSPGAPGPQRKNGLFLAGEGCSDGRKAAFAAELEALRKDSETSTKSMPLSAKDLKTLRKFSTMSADGGRNLDRNRKLSTLSSVSDSSSSYYEYLEGPLHMDSTPHINLGKNFQARVKKWKDREISQLERDAIPDRDECVFDCTLIDHLSQSAVSAYEALSNSKAVPRPGRNKEMALHLLMENKGNIQSSVVDLMRSDTLDWAQYPLVFNSCYLDTEYWSPEDIQRFQDAIYSTEKDFHLMANEMGNKSVKQLIEFYYTWKKACPDDYRKLRNLRRKRQLLEQQMSGIEELNNSNAQHIATCEDSDMTSDAESDATNPSFMISSEQALLNDDESEKLAAIAAAISPARKRSNQLDDNNGFSYWHSQQQARHQIKTEPLMVTPPHSSGPFAPFAQMHSPNMLLQVNVNGSNASNPASSPDSISLLGPGPASVGGLSSLTQKHVPRGSVKKGAQPSADGFFHCRLCDKRFEKVKSLNAHMKSHAMKARAEAEALAQKNQQQNGGLSSQSRQSQPASLGVQRPSQPSVPTPFSLAAGSPSAGMPASLLGANFTDAAAAMLARQSAALRFGPLAAAATSQAGLLNADMFANLLSNPQMHTSLQQLQNASAHNMMMFDQKSQV